MKPTDLIRNRIKDIESGVIKGITTGLQGLDQYTGRIEKGQVWIAGGYTGTGKSYLVLNMIEGILAESETLGHIPKIAVFTTELSEDDYIYRHCLMRLHMYKGNFEWEISSNKPKTENDPDYEYLMQVELEKYDKLIETNVINIYGDITKLEQISQLMTSKTKDNSPDIIFIDYIQELSAEGKYDAKDTMPIIGKKLKELALKWKTAIVAISQVNNYAMSSDNNPNKTQLAPFTFGKELVNAAHCALLITRDKKEGELASDLGIYILKARNGVLRKLNYEIKSGYNLSYYFPQNGGSNGLY